MEASYHGEICKRDGADMFGISRAARTGNRNLMALPFPYLAAAARKVTEDKSRFSATVVVAHYACISGGW